MQAIVAANNLYKIYKSDGVETPALRGVNLTIAPKEFTAIAGPSGSGKSTLLHLLAGLDLPDSGEVWLENERLDDKSPIQRARIRLWKVGFVFQAYNLIPVLTALENAAFVLELRGLPPGEKIERARAALAELEMEEFAERRPSQLSGGQQQRVAVARALAAEPAVVFADEPTANLDSKTGLALIEYMKRLNRDKGLTFVFSTHDPRLLEHVGRIIHLEDGRVTGEENKN